MTYVFGEILVWLVLAVVATAVVCWLLWRWRVPRAEEHPTVVEVPRDNEGDSTALDLLRAELAGAEAGREEAMRGLQDALDEAHDLRLELAERDRPLDSAPPAVVTEHPDAAVAAAKAEMEAAARRVGELTAALEAERRKHAAGGASAPDTRVSELEDTVRARDAELAEVRASLAAASALPAEAPDPRIAELEGAVAAREAELDDVRTELADVRRDVSSADAMQERVEDQAAELLTATQRISDLEAQLDATTRAAEADRASRAAEAETWRRERDAADARAAAAEDQLRSVEAARAPIDEEALAAREQRIVAQLDASAVRIKELEMALAEALRRTSAAELSALDQARAWAVEPPEEATWDDLTQISGVGPKLEDMLHDNGIYTFAQVASLTSEEVDELQEQLPEFPGRIRRDNWVDQARSLETNR